MDIHDGCVVGHIPVSSKFGVPSQEAKDEDAYLASVSVVGRRGRTAKTAASEPMLFPEDAEILALEKKLGLKKTDGRMNWGKAVKEFAQSGFGADFVEFLQDMDRVSGSLKGPMVKITEGMKGEEEQLSDQPEEEEEEEDGSEDEDEDDDDDSEGDEEEEDDDDNEEEEDEEEDSEEEVEPVVTKQTRVSFADGLDEEDKKFLDAAARRKRKQAELYGGGDEMEEKMSMCV